MTFLAGAAVPLTALALVGLSSAGSDASASASLKTVPAAGKQVSKAPSNSSSGTGY